MVTSVERMDIFRKNAAYEGRDSLLEVSSLIERISRNCRRVCTLGKEVLTDGSDMAITGANVVDLLKNSIRNRKPRRSQEKLSSKRKKKKVRKIEEHLWYHGIRTRDDVAPLLRGKGDFLVRANQDADAINLVLNVKGEDGIFDCAINADDSHYSLHSLLNDKGNVDKFTTVSQLIRFYRKHRLPNGKRLVHAVRRPRWLIRHNAIKYDKSGKLGSGNFCDVFKGKATIEDAEIDVAVKICHPPTKDIPPEAVLEARTSMINEAKIMAGYKNDYLIKFYGVACDFPPVMILMELCAGGSLDAHLLKLGKTVTNTEKLVYLLETSQGMRYLHSVNCVHRDLAARNCLIASNGVVKVSDFGLSVILENGKTMCKTIIKDAPIRWFAPECCHKQPLFSKKSDVWAFGTLMYEVFTNGGKPFANEVDIEIVRAIRKANMPPPPEGTPPAVVALFKKIWTLKPDDRPPFSDIVTLLKEAIASSPSLLPADMVVNQLPGVKRTQEICPQAENTMSLSGSKSKMDPETSSVRSQSETASKMHTFAMTKTMRQNPFIGKAVKHDSVRAVKEKAVKADSVRAVREKTVKAESVRGLKEKTVKAESVRAVKEKAMKHESTRVQRGKVVNENKK